MLSYVSQSNTQDVEELVDASHSRGRSESAVNKNFWHSIKFICNELRVENEQMQPSLSVRDSAGDKQLSASMLQQWWVRRIF